MRRLQMLLLIAVICTGTAVAADVDPAAALGQAKAQIAAKKYAEAMALLTPAIDATANIADPAQQKQARTALHFYAAVALSGLMRDGEAMEHLQEAFRLSPNMRNIDTTKYSKPFIALFDRAKAATSSAAGPEGVAEGRFGELYPGFDPAAAAREPSGADAMWEDPAVEFLGSKQEKRAWHDAAAGAQREQVLATFWAARDRTPATPENEYRDAFARRVAFADTAFVSPGKRGALTDRGRVFALLGEPSRVQRRALNRDEARELVALSRGGLGIEVGTVEYWYYTREQLPVAHPAPAVTFRFVTHQGIGDYVLQRDGVPINLLSTAAAVGRQ